MDLGKERMRLIMNGTNSNGNETSVWVTFAGKEEREVVYRYTKDIGFIIVNYPLYKSNG